MRWKKLAILVCSLAFITTGLRAADLILNEYNAVRASRWLDCDGMNCCCLQPVCQGGDNPSAACAADSNCLGHYECSVDGGVTFTGDVCEPTNGDADCTGFDPSWMCEPHTADGVCLCDPPCKQDVFFGRVPGNGGNWIELVVTGNHVDLRGWQLTWTEDPSDAGTLTLTDDPLWADLRAGTIITFTELDTAGGGLDTDTSYDPNGGDWWISINTLSSDGTPQTQYVTTITDVLGDGPGAFSVGNDNWQLTILDADSNVIFGPAGEGIRFVCNGGPLDDEPCTDASDCDGALCEAIRVSSREVFKLQEDPSAGIDPVTSNYKDGTSSTFGHPNIWSGGDKSQDFPCIRCDDGVFCNGPEACDVDGVCQPGDEPCQDLAHCDEIVSTCLECIVAAECDDGNPCTEDTCDGGTCDSAAIPGCGGGNVTPPDEDDDGVADALDECPDTSDHETVDEDGCSCSQLDDDDDGVDDCTDECPETPSGETVDADGCSCLQLDPDGDDDGDGVLNCFDHCEGTLPGDHVDAQGCSCMQLDPDNDSDGDGVPDCLDLCASTSTGATVDDAGCELESPDDTPAPEEVPDEEGTYGDTDPSEHPADSEAEDTVASQSRGCLCGLIGLTEFACLLVGLLRLRFAQHTHRSPGASAPAVALQEVHRTRTS